jgi:fatty acid desaturase
MNNPDNQVEHINKTCMTKQEFFKSNYFKILLGVLIVAMIIAIFRSGYDFGQWLYDILH